jgi:hypothetical protein
MSKTGKRPSPYDLSEVRRVAVLPMGPRRKRPSPYDLSEVRRVITLRVRYLKGYLE